MAYTSIIKGPERGVLYKRGEEMFRRGELEPYPDAAYQTQGYYINAGWRHARGNELQRELAREQEAGLDYDSLDKLSKQLKALGFTIPNEEN